MGGNQAKKVQIPKKHQARLAKLFADSESEEEIKHDSKDKGDSAENEESKASLMNKLDQFEALDLTKKPQSVPM